MTARPPIAPFELDPQRLEPGAIELVQPEPDGPLPVPLARSAAPSRHRPWWRLLLGAGTTFVVALLGLEAYDFVGALFARSPWLGGSFAALLALIVAGALGIAGREIWSIYRLAKVEHLRHQGEQLLGGATHGRAEPLLAQIEALYGQRAEMAELLGNFREQASDALDDSERLHLFAQTVLAPVDRRAYQQVKASARDIGVLTALTPIGALDSLIVMVRTLAMMRAIARLYGVRPGLAATMRLVRSAVRNIVIAGVGDLVSHAAVETVGASILRVLSARVGQGAINGLLAARIGLSIMQICRPLPFTAPELPSLQRLRAEILKDLDAESD